MPSNYSRFAYKHYTERKPIEVKSVEDIKPPKRESDPYKTKGVITDEKVAYIRKVWPHSSGEQVGKLIGLSKGTVNRVAKKLGLEKCNAKLTLVPGVGPKKKKGPTEETKKLLAEMREAAE